MLVVTPLANLGTSHRAEVLGIGSNRLRDLPARVGQPNAFGPQREPARTPNVVSFTLGESRNQPELADWVNDSSLGLDDSWTQATFTFARASTAPHEERWVNLGGRCPGRDRRYLGIQVVLIACPTVSPHGSSSWKDIT